MSFELLSDDIQGVFNPFASLLRFQQFPTADVFENRLQITGVNIPLVHNVGAWFAALGIQVSGWHIQHHMPANLQHPPPLAQQRWHLLAREVLYSMARENR